MRGASILGVLGLLALLSVTALTLDSASIIQNPGALTAAISCTESQGLKTCTDSEKPTGKNIRYGTEITTGGVKEELTDGVPSSSPEAASLTCELGSDYLLKGSPEAPVIFKYQYANFPNACYIKAGRSTFPAPVYLPGSSIKNSSVGERSCINGHQTNTPRTERWQCHIMDCTRGDGKNCTPIITKNLEQRIFEGDPIVGKVSDTKPAPSTTLGGSSVFTSDEFSDEEKKGIASSLDENTRTQLRNSYQEKDAQLAQQQAQKQKELEEARELYDQTRNCTQANTCASGDQAARERDVIQKELELSAIEAQRARLASAQEYLKAPPRNPGDDTQNPPENPPYNPYPGGDRGTFGDGQPWYVTRPAYSDYGAGSSGNDLYCVTNQYPLMVEQRPATPGCLNYRATTAQQQCNSQQGGLFGTVLSLFMKNKSGCGTNGDGSDSNAPTPTCQITASPQNISAGGQSVKLSWQSSRAVQASLSSAGTVATNGSMTVTPQTTTTYTLNLSGARNSQTGQQLRGDCSVQVVVGGQGGGDGAPKAEISCRPQEADVGMSIAVSYACHNSATSGGSGFSTNNQLSGSATPTVEAPTLGSDSVIYGLTCSKEGKTDSAQCVVKINPTSIVLIANPKDVASGEEANIGWITNGMESCTISSPTLASFTSENAGNTSPSGVAKTPALTEDTTFVLTCTTKSGGTKTAETTVNVGN